MMEISGLKRSPRARPDCSDEHVGITHVLCSSHTNARGGKVLHSCMVKPCRPLPPKRSSISSSWWRSSSSTSSWSLSTRGDLLGTESGVHMCGPNDPMPWEDLKPYTSRKNTRKNKERRLDIPPPITILRCSDDEGIYTTKPVPWGGLYREYREGRLILWEGSGIGVQEERGQQEGEEKDAATPIKAVGEEQESKDRKGKRPLIE